jgi:hypothetical protein
MSFDFGDDIRRYYSEDLGIVYLYNDTRDDSAQTFESKSGLSPNETARDDCDSLTVWWGDRRNSGIDSLRFAHGRSPSGMTANTLFDISEKCHVQDSRGDTRRSSECGLDDRFAPTNWSDSKGDPWSSQETLSKSPPSGPGSDRSPQVTSLYDEFVAQYDATAGMVSSVPSRTQRAIMTEAVGFLTIHKPLCDAQREWEEQDNREAASRAIRTRKEQDRKWWNIGSRIGSTMSRLAPKFRYKSEL